MRKLAVLIIVGLFIVAAFPMICAVVSARDPVHVEGIYDDKASEKGKPQKPPVEPPVSDEPADKTHLAVVIGIADYKRGGDLQYTDDDARDVYAYLISMGYKAGSVKLLIDRAATATKIIAALDWLVKYADADSEVFIFYSGHGSQYRDGYNNPVDENDVYDECIVSQDGYLILDDTLRTKVSSIISNKIGVVFDSCFSGGMEELQGQGKVIVTACAETQLSYDGDSTMQNGVFTYYFMIELYIYDTLEEAYSYSVDDVTGWGTENGISFDPLIFDGYTNDWEFVLVITTP